MCRDNRRISRRGAGSCSKCGSSKKIINLKQEGSLKYISLCKEDPSSSPFGGPTSIPGLVVTGERAGQSSAEEASCVLCFTE